MGENNNNDSLTDGMIKAELKRTLTPTGISTGDPVVSNNQSQLSQSAVTSTPCVQPVAGALLLQHQQSSPATHSLTVTSAGSSSSFNHNPYVNTVTSSPVNGYLTAQSQPSLQQQPQQQQQQSSPITPSANHQTHHQSNSSPQPIGMFTSADYLSQLLKDQKQVSAFPGVFFHMERLLNDGT
jgi:hypothetical protein